MQCNVAGTRSNSLHAFSFVALLCVVYRKFSNHSVHSLTKVVLVGAEM